MVNSYVRKRSIWNT